MNISVPPQTGCWPLPGHPYENILNGNQNYLVINISLEEMHTSLGWYEGELMMTEQLFLGELSLGLF